MPLQFTSNNRATLIALGSPRTFLTDERTITAAGDVTVAASDYLIRLNKTVAATTNVILPAASTRTANLFIKDIKGDANNYNFTLVPNGSNDIDGASSYVATMAYECIELHPRTGGTGWDVVSITTNPHIRDVLTAARNYYVRKDGSDSHTGLNNTAAEAFLTIQHAMDIVNNTLDLAGYAVVINVADGTYAENLYVGSFIGYSSFYGYGQARVKATNGASVIIAPTSGIGIFASGNNTPWLFEAMKIGNGGGIVTCVEADSGGVIALKAVTFGACSQDHCLSIFTGTRIAIIESNYTIAGAANIHWHARFGGTILTQAGITCAVSGAPVVGYVAYADEGGLIYDQTTFSGAFDAATISYAVFPGSLIYTFTLAIPGLAGIQQGAGVYNDLLRVGYETGYGGAVSQSTNKATTVVLDKLTGEINTSNANLAADAIVSFTLTNSFIRATDTLILNHVKQGTLGAYVFNAECLAGSATITIANRTTGALAENLTIRFIVIRGAIT